MLTAKRILVVIAIVLCVMQLFSLLVHIIRPKEETPKSPWRDILGLKETEVIRRTMVWYIGGLVFLGLAATLGHTQPWLELSFGIAGVGGLLMGCTGGAFGGQEVLWPRFGLSFLTLTILVLISVRLSRRGNKPIDKL